MSETYDVIVVGAGPAGLSAARVVAQGGGRCAVIDKMGPGGQLMNMGEIRDCAVAGAGTQGPEMIERMVEGAMAAGAELLVDEVSAVTPSGGGFRVTTLEQKLSATVVIIATGLLPGRTGLAGEEELEGRGISHCAVCDGPLYAGKRVVVAGASRWAMQEALDLAETAEHVTLVSEGEVPDLPPDLAAAFAAQGNIRRLTGRIVAHSGAGGLDHVTIEGPHGRERIAARGLFLQINRRPASGLLPRGDALAADGHILVDEDGATGLDGVLACGDVRMGAMQSIDEAIADGERAGQNALRRLKA